VPDHTSGRTDFGGVNILGELAFDLSEGRELSPRLGKTDAPVNVLPAWELDLSRNTALRLTVQVRPGATPVAIAADLVAVYQRLNEFEIRLGGKGLAHADSQPNATRHDAIEWVLAATDPSGAAERLGKLAVVVNDQSSLRQLQPRPSFTSWVAELTNAL
jgi:hypothetical protein